jgi:rhamnosyl/mannosyltransferase
VRVCHLAKYYPPARGGIEAHVETLARAQAALGARVHVICVNHEGGPTRHERDGDVLVTRLSRLGSAAKLDICPDLLSTLSGASADVFHVHVPNPIMILAALASRRRPIVVTYHSDHVRQRLRSQMFSPIERAFFVRARAILATSEPYARSSTLLREHREKVEVIPLGIDIERFASPPPDVELEARKIRSSYPGPLWFFCGRIVYYKGLETAFDALSDCEGTLLIAGDGPDLDRLRARAGDRVRFLGDVQDVRPYYAAAQAFWFPSNARSEAFGLVQVEAMASGCPVINTRIEGSGVPWVSRDGETGLTVPPDDPKALAAAARRLLEPGLRERLARGARARARAVFDHRDMARRTLALYERSGVLAPVS